MIGRAYENPLKHLSFDIEFANSKVTTFTKNAIAKAMYAQCDLDRNEYIPLTSGVQTILLPLTSSRSQSWEYLSR